MRRLDRFAVCSIYAAKLAVLDAGRELTEPERVGVVAGTAYGSIVTSFSLLHEIVEQGDDAGSPFKFTTAVNNATATTVATYLGARGPCLCVLGFDRLLANVLATAVAWLAAGRADLVVAAAADEYHPMVGYGYERLGAWATDGVCRPLAFAERSAVPAETYVAYLLARPGTPGARAEIVSLDSYLDLAGDYRPDSSMTQILAADGRRRTAATYAAVAAHGAPVAAYATAWGTNPSAEALGPLVATLCLERGRPLAMDPAAGAGPELRVADPKRPLAAPEVACVAANRDGSGTVVTLRRSTA